MVVCIYVYNTFSEIYVNLQGSPKPEMFFPKDRQKVLFLKKWCFKIILINNDIATFIILPHIEWHLYCPLL